MIKKATARAYASMNAVEQQFMDAIAQHGLTPPAKIIPDGKIHRFASDGKRGDKAGWYICHGGDVPAGAFGCWRQGVDEKWWADIGRILTPAEEAAHKARLKTIYSAREAEAKKQRTEAKAKAKAILTKAPAATDDHAYLRRKNVKAHGLHIHKGALVVPASDISGEVQTLQFIDADGEKKFLSGGQVKGCSYLIGELGNTICIGEGYATGATVHEATGYPVAVAFNAGNLKVVAEAYRKKYPNLKIIIAGDDDRWKVDANGNSAPNAGRLKAEEAAKHYDCRTAFPVFAESTLERLRTAGEKLPTDWNDLHCFEGIEAVRVQLHGVMQQTPDTPAPARNDAADDAEIVRLAKLPLLEYERERKAAAVRLGIERVAILDKLVQIERDKSASTSGQGRALSFMEVESWPEPVSGAVLFDELAEIFKRFTVLPVHADIALALWVCFTWCIDALQVAPILGIISPEMRCGKTTVLSVLNLLTWRPLPSANISPSSLFRSIEKWQPSLLIDEADTYLRESEEMRGIINSGHTRPTAYVIRNELVGNSYEPCRFSTWAAKAIAQIGKLPGTIADRAIVVTLRRKLPKEKVEKLRYADKSVFDTLRRKLARFAQDNAEVLRTVQPSLPDDISDRAADNWEPLLAIARLAGETWEKKTLQAARELSGGTQEVKSLGAELLADIEAIFSNKHYEKIPSAELIEALCADNERPWATYNRGTPISSRQMAKILSEYGIRSKGIRLESGHTPKGYEKVQFKEAFSCYLPPSPHHTAATTPQSAENLYSQANYETPQDNNCGGLETAGSPRLIAVCGGVADKNTPIWEAEV